MYRLYLMRTVTGEVGSVLDVPSCSWSITLNNKETISATAQKEDLKRHHVSWYSPYSGGLLVTFTDTFGVERPLAAGPITNWGNEDRYTLSLEAEGIRAILAKRTVEHDMALRGLTLGEIAWRLVQEAMDKPGGKLPIVRGGFDSDSYHERTYEKWNLANNNVDKRIREITEVENGPDIMFRPEWTSEKHTSIQWRMVAGTSLSPYIPQVNRQPDFDSTAAMGEVSEVGITSDGGNITSRVWVTGAGEGEGVVREYAQDLRRVEDVDTHMPFLEVVESDSDQSNPARLKEKAQGYLANYFEMIDQLSMKVDIYSEKNPLGSYFAGDTTTVTIDDKWLSIPSGTHTMRLIKIGGAFNSGTVDLEFQESTW